MKQITVYSVLDSNNYRRLETLSQNEAKTFHYFLHKREGGTPSLVPTKRLPRDHTLRDKLAR